jgi:RNA polymerase sigma-70 factor (ECF subfamily)
LIPVQDTDTERLLQLAQSGDDSARDELFAQMRERVRQLIALRMDERLSSRLDASDIVQETFVDASRRLPDFLSRRPVPFYLWLRQIALDRLADAHRRHVYGRRRSVLKEEAAHLSEHSVVTLASHLSGSGSGPLSKLVRAELQERLRAGLIHLEPDDRDVIVMRFLERLRTKEISAVLQITESAVKWRVQRALERLQRLLTDSKET